MKILALGFPGLLREGAERLGGNLELHPVDVLGLDIDREGTARLDVRVAAVIAGLSSTTGQLACSAHSVSIQLLGNTGESIMDEQEWQVPYGGLLVLKVRILI